MHGLRECPRRQAAGREIRMTSATSDPFDASPGGNRSPPRAGSELPPKVIILANPYSGARKNRQHVAELTHALTAEGLQPQPIWQLDELEAVCREPGFADEFRCVVAAGGDGTLNRTINYRLNVPLAVLPLGNENLFARQFGFTTDSVLLAGKIARGQTRSIDLGRAGGRLFSVVASGGFDGDVAHRLANWRQDKSRLRRVGSHSYLLPIATSFCWYPYPSIELEADGQRVSGALAMVFNVPRYALGLRLCPDATPDDGWLDWVVFTRPGGVRLAVYAAAVVLGQHRRLSDVRYGRARRIWLRSATSVPLELDGEAAEFTPVEIAVEPMALRIVTG